MKLIKQLTGHYQDIGLTVALDSYNGGIETAIAPEVLETVLTNLLDNSRQQGADKVSISLAMAGDVVEIALTDNGRGISAANAGKIFTPFFTTHRETGGTGLGLVIVSTLLQAHHGSVVHQPSENGARFVIRLPGKTA